MKLYIAAFAPNPRRVLWLMAEKGMTGIETVTLDILTGEHRNHPALKASGALGLPALELDDGTCLAESVAVCRYLESLVPEPSLFGRTAEEAAIIEMWTRRVEMTAATPLMMAARMSHPALEVLETPNPVVAEHYIARARQALIGIDERLKGRDFIAVDRISMADIILMCALDFVRVMLRFKPDPELSELARWREAMKERPAYMASR